MFSGDMFPFSTKHLEFLLLPSLPNKFIAVPALDYPET